jgi:hypothetical protein
MARPDFKVDPINREDLTPLRVIHRVVKSLETMSRVMFKALPDELEARTQIIGTGNPEGVVAANETRTFTDASTPIPSVYFNISGVGSTTGWVKVN